MKDSSKNDSREGRRVMKPVIEKKRRDRMNHSLEELRTLLMNHTKDTRLRNPKLEKAEILELTVEYLRGRITGGGRADPLGGGESGSAESSVKNQNDGRQDHDWPFFSPIYMAGYRQCAFQLTSFIDCVNPSMRESFMRALGQHQDPQNCSPPWGGRSQTPPGDRPLWFSAAEALRSMEDGKSATSHMSCRRPESFHHSKTVVPFYPASSMLHHHHPWSQPIAPPYPSPPYSISPPPSPCYSNSSPTLNSPPPYLSIPCHFPFPQNLSPLSPKSSSTPRSTSSLPVPAASTLGPLVSVRAGLPFIRPPHVTPLSRSPTVLQSPAKRGQGTAQRRQLFPAPVQSLWRPWS